jgi:cation-transporting P-type ATPase C
MTTALALEADFSLLSSIPGRQRWSVPAILNRPRYALAVRLQLEQAFGAGRVQVNAKTGRILLESAQDCAGSEHILARALQAKPVSQAVALAKQSEIQRPGKARKLLSKLLIGGTKLLLIFANGLIWGSIAASPVAIPLTILSIAGTFITGYDFLRALARTMTGRSPITTGTLVGAATISSVMLRENVTALIVLWLLNLGEYLEILTLRRTRKAIRQLLSTEDDEVWVLCDGIEVSMRLDAVRVDDLVVVRAGRRIGVDGIIDGGSCAINEAPITGESMPVSRTAGDSVYAGTILVSGQIRLRVTEVGSDTVVGRLIQRVEQAQTLRPRIQTVGDAFAKRVVPSSFAAALLVLVVTRDPRRALTMLLVACPCAAGLATPTAVSASIGNAARRGILIKGGTHLEAMSKVDTVCFDKTGTLTDGEPAVTRVLSVNDRYTSDQVLEMAASVERHSQHPLALAVMTRAAEQEVVFAGQDDQFEILPGRGVRSWTEESEILVGNERLLEEYSVPIADATATQYREYAGNAETAMYVTFQRELAGIITVSAPIRSEARESIAQLRKAGINRLVMLTGDAEPVAQRVANVVGIQQWRSRLLPQDKFDAIQNLRDHGHRVAMVGDGINDAPALALANVGIALGTGGSDVALETADIALAADDLRKITSVVNISRQTMSVVRQNYGLALGTNSIGLYLAAAGSINPIIAAILHNLSTILVIVNSTRLIQYDPAGRRERWTYSSGSSTGLESGEEHEDEGACHACSGAPRTQKQSFKQQTA